METLKEKEKERDLQTNRKWSEGKTHHCYRRWLGLQMQMAKPLVLDAFLAKIVN